MALLTRLGHPLVTVALTAVLTLILGVGALVAAARGSAHARALVFDLPLLDALLCVCALHLLLALVSHCRRGLAQWYFACLDAGLLLLALGTLLTRLLGAIGSATLAVGGTANAFELPGTELHARWGADREAVADLGVVPPTGPVHWQGDEGPLVHIVDVATDAELQVGIGPGAAADGPGVALRFGTLSTSFSTWLLGSTPFFRQKQVGPVDVEYLVAPDDTTLQGWLPAQATDDGQVTVVFAGSGERLVLDLPREVASERRVGDVTVVAHRYLLHARLIGEQLVDDVSAPVNPAAVVAVRRGEVVETHTVFSQQPEFNLIAGRGQNGLVDAIELAANGVGKQRRVRILGAKNGRHFVQVLTSTARGEAWPLELGRSVVLGDLGLDAMLEKFLPHATARAWPRPAARMGSGSDFVCIAKGTPDTTTGAEWLRIGADATLQIDGAPVVLTYRARRAKLPFDLSAMSATVDRRPGSSLPSRYTSELAIRDGSAPAQRVTLGNHAPTDWFGHRLVHRGYAPGQGDQPATIVLAVGLEPGRHLVHAGLLLLLLGAFGLLLRRAPRSHSSGLTWLVSAAALLAPLSAQSFSALPLDSTRDWPVQHDGRLQPLESWARAQLAAIGGPAARDIIEPLEFVWALQFAPASVRLMPLVRVTGTELRRSLQLPEDRRRMSYDALLADAAFRSLVEAAQADLPEGAERLPVAQQALEVYERLLAMAAITDGTALRMLPTGRADGSFASLADLRGDGSAQATRLLAELQAIAAAARAGDAAGFGAHAAAFRRLVDDANGGSIAGAAERQWELMHADLDASTRALLLYLLATVLLLWPTRSHWPARFGAAAQGAGLLLQVASALASAAATGRLPVASPPEGLRFAALAAVAVAFALSFCAKRTAPLAAASPFGLTALLLAAGAPTSDPFGVLPPGLADTAWLSVHGAANAAAFGALALAALLAHGVALRPTDERLLRAMTAARLLGTALLIVGIASGVAWAERGWGRQFGFEAKEIWTAATGLIHIALLVLFAHGRWSASAQANATIAAFAPVVGTWLLLDSLYRPGLHTQAAPVGVGPILVWFSLEVAFVAFAALRRRFARLPA